MKKTYVGDGKVVLLAGGGKIFTDVAARFVRSEKSLENILSNPYDGKIVQNILDRGHLAAVEFDYFIFGIEGYARVTETQLVRKRLASYLFKSGRPDKGGKRSFDVVIPEDIEDFEALTPISGKNILTSEGEVLGHQEQFETLYLKYDSTDLLSWTEMWYNKGVEIGKKEEELRYMKQQATEVKAIIGMNAHALLDWFQIRTCKNAQTEIRDLAFKMMNLCKEAAPDLFAKAGPSCVTLGYCPENEAQNKKCKGCILTKNEALKILSEYKKGELCSKTK